MNSCDTIHQLIKDNKFYLHKSNLDDKKFIPELIKIIKNTKFKKTGVFYLVGGVAAGKTTLINKLQKQIDCSSSIKTEDFLLGDRNYRWQKIMSQNKPPLSKYDFNLLRNTIKKIKNLENGSIKVPEYNEITGIAVCAKGKKYQKKIEKTKYLFIEGDFYQAKKNDCLFYLHTPDNIRMENRINRDIKTRGETTKKEIRKKMNTINHTQHFKYTLPIASQAQILFLVHPTKTTKQLKYKYDIYFKNQHVQPI